MKFRAPTPRGRHEEKAGNKSPLLDQSPWFFFDSSWSYFLLINQPFAFSCAAFFGLSSARTKDRISLFLRRGEFPPLALNPPS
jgi:hypothetical protein